MTLDKHRVRDHRARHLDARSTKRIPDKDQDGPSALREAAKVRQLSVDDRAIPARVRAWVSRVKLSLSRSASAFSWSLSTKFQEVIAQRDPRIGGRRANRMSRRASGSLTPLKQAISISSRRRMPPKPSSLSKSNGAWPPLTAAHAASKALSKISRSSGSNSCRSDLNTPDLPTS